MTKTKTPIIQNGTLYWRCSKCGNLKESTDFCKDQRSVNGLHSSCKICHTEVVKKSQRKNPEKTKATQKIYEQSEHGKTIHKKWYRENPERLKVYSDRFRQSEKGKRNNRKTAAKYRDNNPKKVRAQQLAYLARSRRDLIPQACEICGTTENIHAHHDDYDKPLEVRWLCRTHHNSLHRQENQDEKKLWLNPIS